MTLALLDLNRADKPRSRIVPKGPKPRLAYTQKPIFNVYYKDLEAYIEKVFGFRDFDLLFAAGIQEGIGVDYTVNGLIPNTSAYGDKVEDIRDGRRSKDVLLLLNLLVKDGYIPAGVYSVNTTKRNAPHDDYRALLMRTRDVLHPECLAFKVRFKDDAKVMDCVSKLDTALLERQSG
jgi:hypothetical protein